MDTSLISILLPTYNGSRYIREAIDSVLAQDFHSFELIIINDASTDKTGEILEEYRQKDSRVRILTNPKNLRLVASLNYWIQESKGEYIARIDDDDIWIDQSKLSKQIHVFQENSQIGIVGTLGEIIDDAGEKTGKKILHATSQQAVRWGFCFRNQLIHTSILAKKEILVTAGWYITKWLYVEDFDLWLRVLALGYEIVNLHDFSVLYRVRSWSTTGRKYHRMQWLTFSRLFHETSLYTNIGRKLFFLFLRWILVVVPIGFSNYFK